MFEKLIKAATAKIKTAFIPDTFFTGILFTFKKFTALKQQLLTISAVWRNALQGKSFRNEIIASFAVLLVCAWAAPKIFQHIQHRTGTLLHDFVLEAIPSIDLSVWIFTLLYLLIIISILALLTEPDKFLITLQAYILLTLLRFNTMEFVPLEPPIGMITLIDPFVQYFFYQETITKDLFFSGHTSILVVLGLGVPFRKLSVVVLCGAGVIGVMLLLQHAHYTIDVLAAPVFALAAHFSVKKLHSRKGIQKGF